jgi:Tfp pilus assembly protein PilP
MMMRFVTLFYFLIFFQVAQAQNPPPMDPNQPPPPAQGPPPVPAPSSPMMEDLGDGSDLIMKKNNFNYDSNDGRDPFKIFRETPTFPTGPVTQGPGPKPENNAPPEKSIHTAMVPGEIIVQGILYRKNDPIVLISVRGIRGLNKLKLNSPIGRNEGKIVDIQRDRIVIEQVKDFDGQKFTEKLILKVREKKN